jgi:choline dehydrogenase-like flavoprotein
MSRITLSDDMDKFGMPRLRLNWRITRKERQKIYQSMRFFGMKVGQNGFGRLQIDKRISRGELEDPPGKGYHHMGTTRMADSPKDGVVDKDCRVFGLDNFYIAGSSVFVTSGCSNPTFTILALAIRLADHLKKKM